jgi:hypothetical protein
VLLYSASASARLLTTEIGIVGLEGLFGRLLASCLHLDRSVTNKTGIQDTLSPKRLLTRPPKGWNPEDIGRLCRRVYQADVPEFLICTFSLSVGRSSSKVTIRDQSQRLLGRVDETQCLCRSKRKSMDCVSRFHCARPSRMSSNDDVPPAPRQVNATASTTRSYIYAATNLSSLAKLSSLISVV